MLKTDQITDSLQRNTRQPEVIEFASGIQRCGIKNDVVMNMRPVRVRCDDECVLALGETKCKFPPQCIRVFRRDLAGFERLADLIGNHIMPGFAACDLLILPFGQKEFLIDSHRITHIAGDQFAFFCFLRITRIICPVTKTLRNCFSLIHMQWDQSCRCHLTPPSSGHKKPGKFFFFPRLHLNPACFILS